MARPDFTLKWAGSRLSIPAISAGNYAAGWDTYLGPLPPLGDDHDYVMNLQDSRAIWLGEQMLLAVGHEWQDDVTYDAYAVVRSPVNGQLYRSLAGGNLNNEPSVSGAQWAPGVADSADLLNAPIATVAAAGTINLTTGAPDTSQIAISGTGVTITGFTVEAGRCYFVRFAGALTLTNNANIVTQSGANITTAAGDTCILRATAANVVEVLCYVVGAVTGTGSNVLSASPALTGVPTAPTAAPGTNTTQIATTGFAVESGGRFNTTRINVASAATVNLTTAAPNTRHINITGTTTITAFTVAVGQTYFVRFDGVLTLTNNASLVTQTSANIVTAAGDTCIIRATAANTVEVLSYTPAGGWAKSLAANGYQKLPSGLIIQWGRTAAIGEVETTVVYPVAFPNQVFSLVFGQIASATTASAIDRVYWDEAASSLSSAVIGRDTDTIGPGSIPITFFAIGY